MKTPRSFLFSGSSLTVTAMALAAPACSAAAVSQMQHDEAGVDGGVDSQHVPLTDGSTDDGPASDGAALDSGVPLDDAGCPTGRGPTMAKLPASDGGAYCIDTTEVTNAQYAAFVDAGSALLGSQPSQCASNTSFDPFDPADAGTVYTPAFCGYDPVGRANYPVACVTWCDAVAFCQWAGKALCSSSPSAIWPRSDQWTYACSSAGKYKEMYGPALVPGRCVDNTVDASQPVGSFSGCHPEDPPFDRVFDLLGNVDEWSTTCTGQGCYFVGANYHDYPTTTDCFQDDPMLIVKPVASRFIDLGFRCCSQE